MEVLHSVGAGRAQQSCRHPSLVLTFLGRAVTEGEPQVAATDFLYGNGHLQGRARWQHSIFPVPSHPQHLLVLRDCWFCKSPGSSTKAGARCDRAVPWRSRTSRAAWPGNTPQTCTQRPPRSQPRGGWLSLDKNTRGGGEKGKYGGFWW